MDEATIQFLRKSKPRKRAEQTPEVDPAIAIYDLNRRQEPIDLTMPETTLTPKQHFSLYHDLLQRNANSLNNIVRLRRIVEGAEEGDALGLAVKIINDLSNTSSSRSLVGAYQNRT